MSCACCVQAQSRQLEKDTKQVSAEREQLLVLAESRRHEVRALEQGMLEERVRLDSRCKAERLKHISLVEEQYRCVCS
jgi:lipid A disaccharide synthetase